MDLSYLAPQPEARLVVHTEYYIKHNEGEKGARKIYETVQYDRYELEKIEELKREIAKKKIVLPKNWRESDYLKVGYSGRFKMKEVLKKLEANLQWRSNPVNHQLSSKIEKFLQEGIIYTFGRDKQFRPIVILNAHKINLNQHDRDLIIQSLSFIMGVVRNHMFIDGKVENWIFILETNEIGVMGLPLKALGIVIDTMGINFAGCLDKMFILNPSTTLDFIWSSIKGMLDAETTTKINFITKKKLKILQDQIDPHQLEQKYGGTQRNVTKFWPPYNLDLPDGYTVRKPIDNSPSFNQPPNISKQNSNNEQDEQQQINMFIQQNQGFYLQQSPKIQEEQKQQQEVPVEDTLQKEELKLKASEDPPQIVEEPQRQQLQTIEEVKAEQGTLHSKDEEIVQSAQFNNNVEQDHQQQHHPTQLQKSEHEPLKIIQQQESFGKQSVVTVSKLIAHPEEVEAKQQLPEIEFTDIQGQQGGKGCCRGGTCNSGVGKTTIIARYIDNKFLQVEPTHGIHKQHAQLDFNDKTQSANLIDMSGLESNKEEAFAQYKNTQCIVLVYDVANRNSFTDLAEWHKCIIFIDLEITHYNHNINYWIVVANKIDLRESRKVSPDEGRKYSQSIGAKFIECSAVLPQNISLIFLSIASWIQTQINSKTVSNLPCSINKILEKLNKSHDEEPKTLQVSHKSKKAQPNVTFDASINNDSISDYFHALNKQLSTNYQQVSYNYIKLADQMVKSAADKIRDKLQSNIVKINPNQFSVYDETVITEKDGISQLKYKFKKQDKQRRELDQNLYLIQEQLKVAPVDEISKLNKLAKQLQKRLIEIEKTMDLLKTDILLTEKTHNFSSNGQIFNTLDQSQIIKQQIKQVIDPEHIKQQNLLQKKYITERKLLEKARSQRILRYQQKLQNDQQSEALAQQNKNKDDQLKKQSEIKSRLQSLEKLQQDRKIQIQSQNKLLKQLNQMPTLHDQLQERYNSVFVETDKKDHEQTLQVIKDQHKPIRLPDLKAWEDQYLKNKNEKETLRKQKYQERQAIDYKATYESKTYQDARKELHNKLDQKTISEQKLNQKQQLLNEFQKKLKDHLPVISQDKHDELEILIQQRKHKPNYLQYIDMAQNVKQKGYFFDDEGKLIKREIDSKHYEDIKNADRNYELTPRTKGNNYLMEIKKELKQSKTQEKKMSNCTSPIQKTQEKQTKVSNFNQIKSEWKLKQKNVINTETLQNVIQNKDFLGYGQQEIVQGANKIAMEAQKKLQLLENKKWNFEEVDQAQQEIVDSIKAKLILLDDQHPKKIQGKRRSNSRQSI